MRKWILLLSGLLIWAAHFFALYAVASLFPGTRLAHILALVLTAAALAAAGWLLWRMRRLAQQDGQDRLTDWMAALAATGNALALVAIAYQAAPSVLL
jgi:hypothetical protein